MSKVWEYLKNKAVIVALITLFTVALGVTLAPEQMSSLADFFVNLIPSPEVVEPVVETVDTLSQ